MVSHNRVHSQAAFECVKNKNNAHHVLDEMLLRQHKFQQRKKPSLSPKSRMFKFKNKMLQRNRSQMDPHHVMDSNIVTYISSSSRAKFGFKWKEHNSRYWGRMRQTRLHMRHKWKSKHLRAVVGLQNNPSYALDVVIKPVLECNTTAAISQLVLERSVSHDCFLGSLWEKKSVSWLGLACVLAECMMHTTTVISAKLYSLFSFEVVTEENISSGLSQTSQVWEPGGVLAEHVLVDWLVDFHDYAEIVEGIRCLVIGVCSGLQQPIDSRRASRVWERGGLDIRTDHGGLLVFPWHLMLLEFFLFFYFGRQAVLDQFTKGLEMKQKMKVLKSWRFKYKPATSSSMLPFYVNQMGASDIQENDKEMVADPVKQAVFNLITTAARFGLVSVLIWLTVWRVLYLLGTLFWSTSFKKEKFGKNWWYKFKHSLWQREWDSELLAVEVVMAATVVDVRIDDVGRSELLIKWQDHDASEYLWMFSKAFVHLYPSYKLEDKLGLEGVSIDTIHHRNIGRRSRPAHQELVVGRADVAETSKKRERLCFRVKLCR